MTPDTLRRIVAHLAGLGGAPVDLIGAEPTTNPALSELVATVAEAGFAPRLFTNGTLVTVPLARALAAAGLREATVSLDGFRDATHDGLRGMTGAQERTLRGMRALAGEGIEVTTFTVVRRENFREMADLAGLARAHAARRSAFHWISAVPAALCDATEVSDQYRADGRALLEEGETSEFAREVGRALRAAPGPSLALVSAWGEDTLTRGRFPLATCRYTNVALSVGSDGGAYPCSHFARARLGSLVEGPWQAVWQGPQRARFREGLARGLPAVCAYCCHHVHNLSLAEMAGVALRLAAVRFRSAAV